MKIISLGGGSAEIHRVKLSSGVTRSVFINRIEDGADIWDRLTSPSPTFGWQDDIGEFSWEYGENIEFNWQTE